MVLEGFKLRTVDNAFKLFADRSELLVDLDELRIYAGEPFIHFVVKLCESLIHVIESFIYPCKPVIRVLLGLSEFILDDAC